jgi:hypothetical protein
VAVDGQSVKGNGLLRKQSILVTADRKRQSDWLYITVTAGKTAHGSDVLGLCSISIAMGQLWTVDGAASGFDSRRFQK